jgi:Ca2+-transporting ATPase
MLWHHKDIAEVVAALESSPQGLGSSEARQRLERHGRNELRVKPSKQLPAMIAEQFKDLFILILMAAAVVAGLLGDTVEAIAIFAIVVLNAIIGVIQEYRAEKALEALRGMAAPVATVVRDGVPAGIPAAELVPGDVVMLEAGRIVPADMRLIEAAQLKAEEAALTGESIPVDKQTAALPEEHLPLADRKNMAYSGTFITYGRGRGIVVATGMATELGKIAHMLEETKVVQTPLQRRLAAFSRRLAVAIFVIVGIIFLSGMLRGQPLMLMFLTAVSLAVAAIPEALPAVVTIALAFGARKMARQNALIRNLPAVETLGSVTYICSDKTGTLTIHKMTAEQVFCNGALIAPRELGNRTEEHHPINLLLLAMALSNDAFLDKHGMVAGDPTEIALYLCARDAGYAKEALAHQYQRTAEIPFDSERKLMTTFHAWSDGRLISFTKGAVESVLQRSTAICSVNGSADIDRPALQAIYERMAAQGLRVLGLAMRTWHELPAEVVPDRVEQDLVLLGFVGMIDPPREEAYQAVALCKTAGITPVMITGDHPVTARAIAQRLAIIDDTHSVLTGSQLEAMSQEELHNRAEHIRVYARIAPEQKLNIVSALQSRSQFVAMTGDGVNDAPALHKADIGVAMGITGTDVAKEAADMILLDDNFATLVNAVREGRRIYDNIIKFITYSLTSNAATIWLIFLAPFLGLPLPLLPIQILWINLLCDSLPGLALTAEPADAEVMLRPPRPSQEGVFAGGRRSFVLVYGFIIGMLFLGFQAAAARQALAWQTMLFTGVVLARMSVALAVASHPVALVRKGILSNKYLIGAILITTALHMMIVYLPACNHIFKTTPLSLQELGLTCVFALVPLVAIEIKRIVKPIKS